MIRTINKYLKKPIIKKVFIGSFIFLTNFQTNISSKDTLDNYLKQKFEDRNIKTFNILENLIACDSSFYSGNIKNKIYEIEHLNKYTGDLQNKYKRK